MKKGFYLIVFFLVFPCICMSVSAAEVERFEFELIQFGDVEYYTYWGELPDGLYDIYIETPNPDNDPALEPALAFENIPVSFREVELGTIGCSYLDANNGCEIAFIHTTYDGARITIFVITGPDGNPLIIDDSMNFVLYRKQPIDYSASSHIFNWKTDRGYDSLPLIEYKLPDGVYDVYLESKDGTSKELVSENFVVSIPPVDNWEHFEYMKCFSDLSNLAYRLCLSFVADSEIPSGIVTTVFLEYDSSYAPEDNDGLEVDTTGKNIVFYPSVVSSENDSEVITFFYEGIDLLSSLMDIFFALLSGNPLFCALFAGSLLLVCIPLFAELKRKSK